MVVDCVLVWIFACLDRFFAFYGFYVFDFYGRRSFLGRWDLFGWGLLWWLSCLDGHVSERRYMWCAVEIFVLNYIGCVENCLGLSYFGVFDCLVSMLGCM